MTETERRDCVKKLHESIVQDAADTDDQLWETVLAYQKYPFYTLSGLEFFYEVKRRKNGECSGELLISRKETSKTLTRSSVMLAFYRVLGAARIAESEDGLKFIPPEYKGPKAIGQIFGISYIYSMFLEFKLIRRSA